MQLALLRRLSSVECISAVAVISSPWNALKFITLLVDFIRQIYEPPVKLTQMHNNGIHHHHHLNSVTTNPGVRRGEPPYLANLGLLSEETAKQCCLSYTQGQTKYGYATSALKTVSQPPVSLARRSDIRHPVDMSLPAMDPHNHQSDNPF
jgi:hypothetical protein